MVFLCFFRSEVAEVHFDQPWPTGGAWTVAQQLFAELQCQGGYQNTVGHSEIRRYRSLWHQRLELRVSESFFGKRILLIDLPMLVAVFPCFRCLYCIQPMGLVSLSWLSSRRLSGVLRDVSIISSLNSHKVHGDSMWLSCSTLGHKADTLNEPCPVNNYTTHSSF